MLQPGRAEIEDDRDDEQEVAVDGDRPIIISFEPDRSAIRIGEWKLIVEGRPRASDRKLELYNLERDRGESRNMAQRRPDVANRLLDELVEATRERRAPMRLLR